MIHTVKFNKPVAFTDHTGVTFVNTTTAETASLVTSATVSPSDVIAYDVTWVTDPVAGDVVEWRYNDAIGNYTDSVPVVETTFKDTFSDVAGVAINSRSPEIDTLGLGWQSTNINIETTGNGDCNSSAANAKANIQAGSVTNVLSFKIRNSNTGVNNVFRVSLRQQTLNATPRADDLELSITMRGGTDTVTFTVNQYVSNVNTGEVVGFSAVTGLGGTEVGTYHIEDSGSSIRMTNMETGLSWDFNMTNVTSSPSVFTQFDFNSDPADTFFGEVYSEAATYAAMASQDFELTNCLDPTPNNTTGFVDYGNTNHINYILSASLTSPSELGGGSFPGVGTETYSANGVICGAVNNPYSLRTLTTGEKDKINAGGTSFTLTCYVDADWYSEIYNSPTLEYVLGSSPTVGLGFTKQDVRVKARNSNFGVVYRGRSEGLPSQIRIDMVIDNGQIDCYANYMIVTQETATAIPSDALDFLGIGSTPNGGAVPGHSVKNIQLVAQGIEVYTNHPYNHIHCFGHSFVESGDYPSGATSVIQGDKGLGDGEGDGRTLATLHRHYGENNIGFDQGHIRNNGVGGDTINQFAAQVTAGLLVQPNQIIAYVNFGANDVQGSGLTPGYKATYQTEITRLIAAGATIILIGNQTSLSNDPTKDTQLIRDNTDECNTVHNELVSENAECHLVELFNYFGGHSPNSAWFGTNDIHPNTLGYNIIGNRIWEVLKPLIGANK